MIKYLNYLLLSILVLLFFIFNINSFISTNLTTLLPKGEKQELVEEFLDFKSTKKLFITIKGFENSKLKEIKLLEKKLSLIKGLEKDNLKINTNLESFKKEYSFYYKTLDIQKTSTIKVSKELKNIKDNIFNSFITTNIDKNDPLKLFKLKSFDEGLIKNGHLVLKDYGYLAIFTIDSSDNSLTHYEQLYDDIKEIVGNSDKITIFSPFFYHVENSRAIKSDTTKIIFLASFILLILYLVILKNFTLLLNTISSLAISALTSLIVLTFFYTEISIFVLVFGLSISSVAIDYMFHHYLHNHYNNKNTFNKEVFFGFITTFSAFLTLSFSDFLLIKQICYFAMLSLLISYLQFAFIYPKIKFKLKETKVNIQFSFNLKTKQILSFSIIVISLLISFMTFDFNIKHLDYNNLELKQKESFFNSKLKSKEMIPLLIQAKSIDNLISYHERIKLFDKSAKGALDELISLDTYKKQNNLFTLFDFNKIKQELEKDALKLGFKKDAFLNSYSNIQKEAPRYTYKTLKSFGLDVKKYKDTYITYILVSKEYKKELSNFSFIKQLSLKELFENDLKKNLQELFYLGILTLIIVITLLTIFTRKRVLHAISYLLFPIAMILIYSYFTPFNILHIFMIFIILAIGIDYAIYSSKSLDINTKTAIIYSLLSTFAGFGVLIFSNINSLYSIGTIATIGIVAIVFLIIFSKDFRN